MSIIKWFIQKIKNAVKNYQAKRMGNEVYWWLESWRNAWEWREQQVADERLHKEAGDAKQAYLEQCREDDEQQAQYEKELLAQILEDKHTEAIIAEEELILQVRRDDIIWEREQCPSCGYPSWECTCYLDEQDDKPEVPQMGLPAHEEEETPLWLEQANEECPNCGLLPEFCQCQYEE